MRRGPTGMMLKALSLTRRGSLSEAASIIQKALKRVVIDIPGPAAFGIPDRAARAPVGPAAPSTDLRPAPAPATPDAVVETGFISGRHTFSGSTRAYKLFVPAQLASAPSLIVMLHGCTQGPDDFAAGTRMNEWAAREGFLVLYPEQSRSANPSGCWNWFQTNDQQRDHGETGLIASLTRSVVERYRVDARRVYVAGLSAGGAMAANLAAAYPEMFAAVGIHSGLVASAANNVVDALSAMRKGAGERPAAGKRQRIPTIVFHGDDDHTVHPSNGDRIVAAALDGGTGAPEVQMGVAGSGRAYSRHSYRGRNGSVDVEHWTLQAAGHAWAGGDARGSFTDPEGVDATAEMLRFFATHRSETPPPA